MARAFSVKYALCSIMQRRLNLKGYLYTHPNSGRHPLGYDLIVRKESTIPKDVLRARSILSKFTNEIRNISLNDYFNQPSHLKEKRELLQNLYIEFGEAVERFSSELKYQNEDFIPIVYHVNQLKTKQTPLDLEFMYRTLGDIHKRYDIDQDLESLWLILCKSNPDIERFSHE